jgi:hypothetical protein
MLNFIKKHRTKIYNILNDVICVFGIILFNWNIINIMLFYWLDITLMVIFVSLILKKANNIPFGINMLPGAILMFGMLAIFYSLIVSFGIKMGYEIKDGFLMALEPKFMIPIFLCSSFIYNYKEYKTYDNLLNIKKGNPYLYPQLFIMRLFSIEGILLISVSIKLDEITAVILIVFTKALIQLWENKKQTA